MASNGETLIAASPYRSPGPPSMALALVASQNNSASAQRAGSRRSGPEEEARKQKEKEFIDSMNGWLMTVAALLMNMAFQAGLNIPGGAWSSTQYNTPTISTSTSNTQSTYTTDPGHTAGQPIIMNIDRYRYYILMVFDVIAFACSMSIIILLLFKKSPEHRLLGIRKLLVYDMVVVAIIYVLGCTPYSGFILFILAVGGTFTFIQLTCGSILCGWLDIFLGWLTKLWNWVRGLCRWWDKFWASIFCNREQHAAA